MLCVCGGDGAWEQLCLAVPVLLQALPGYTSLDVSRQSCEQCGPVVHNTGSRN